MAHFLPASVSFTETWDRVYKEDTANHNLVLPLPPHQVTEAAVASVLNQDYGTEAETYPPLIKCLRKHLQKGRTKSSVGAKVWETHGKGFENLEGRKPDFSITTGGLRMFDRYSIIAIWEAKAYKNDLNKDGLGQLYSYLKLLSVTQPDRLKFVGVLSNLRQNQVVTLTKVPAKTKDTAPTFICKSYRPIELGAVITYLRDSILPDPEFHPQVTPFSYDLGEITRRLGNPAFNLVAAFEVPKRFTRAFNKGRWINPSVKGCSSTFETMVVKRSLPEINDRAERPVASEIEILRYIHDENGHPNLPEIIFHDNLNHNEFGMRPFGAPIKPGVGTMRWDIIITDVLNALEWLHKRHIIHRDVRWDNVIWDTNHAVLIDLGASVQLTDDDTTYGYSGGYICCPRRLIGNMQEKYLPRPADDCLAFVQMFNMLLWPGPWQGVASPKVAEPNSYEAQKLEAFWMKLETSPQWKPYVKAAERTHYKTLAKLRDWCMYW